MLCRLKDGCITGYGHGYEVNRERRHKFVDKLIINDGKNPPGSFLGVAFQLINNSIFLNSRRSRKALSATLVYPGGSY